MSNPLPQNTQVTNSSGQTTNANGTPVPSVTPAATTPSGGSNLFTSFLTNSNNIINNLTQAVTNVGTNILVTGANLAGSLATGGRFTNLGTVAGVATGVLSGSFAGAIFKGTPYEVFIEKLRNAYKVFNEGTFNGQDWDSIQTQGQTIYSMVVRESNAASGLPPEGIIPTVLSFTVDGIGGLKIGQSFRVNKGILPERYYEQFGYIITGLNHSIQDNRWVTEVKAQTYFIGKVEQEEIDRAKLKLEELKFPQS